MPEPMTLLFALAGIILLGFVFNTIDVVKDVGRTIGLVLLAVMVVLMSDRLAPWLQRQNFSFDRLRDLRNFRLNPFAVRVVQPGWQDVPYFLSNQPPPRPVPPRIVPPQVVLPVPSQNRPPTTSSAANNPQTVEPYLNRGVAPPPPIVPPYSNRPGNNRPGNRPSPVPPARPGSEPIPGLW